LAIKTDGGIYYGAGVPQQVIDYVNEKISELSLDEYEDIVTFLGNLIEGDTLTTLLNDKVDKVEGKSLIDSDFASDVPEIVSTLINSDYMRVETDNNRRILSGRKSDGTKFENMPFETPGSRTEIIDNQNWLNTITDKEGNILEGLNKKGEKFIGVLTEDTKQYINDIVIPKGIITVPVLDSNFSCLFPFTIYNEQGIEDNTVKGLPNAGYKFDLRLSEIFNIRFKFKITENLINAERSATIAKLGSTPVVTATPSKLEQYTSTTKYNGISKTNYWTTLKGGLKLNNSNLERNTSQGYDQHIGEFAFSIKYTGEESNVTIENDGTGIIIIVGETASTFLFENYTTVYSLYEALSALADFTVSYNNIEGRESTELAIFEPIKLISTYYTPIDGTKDGVNVEYIDACEFYLPYAVENRWHQVEIIKQKNDSFAYVAIDGYINKYSYIGNTLTLGGDCGVLFKNLEIDPLSMRDAEVITNDKIISSVSPYIIFFEGHGMFDSPSEAASTTGNLNQSTDRYNVMFDYLIGKGYTPISINDAVNYYLGVGSVPKRCFTLIFDDYRFENCMDIKYRRVFTRYGIKPSLAVITGRSMSETITHNGETITIEKAADICRLNGFDLISHTKNHTNLAAIKPSEYKSLLTEILYDADVKCTDGKVLVYPFGRSTVYMHDVANWLGFTMGITVEAADGWNIGMTNRFIIKRIDTANQQALQDIINKIY